MVLVPGGEFTAGSGSIARRVSVEAFFMDKYEVTAALYKKFLQAVSRKEPESWASASFPRDANRPVIGVDWQDADAYCRWAGKRLPTEMEWEKAARGTDGRLYPWGNDPPDPKRANYQKRAYNAYAEGLASVGSYEAGKSPYGLYDMAGNVWEWVADWYDDEYYRNGPARNPPGPPSGEEKVIRGGSWDFQAQAMLAASRLWFAPTMRAPFIGFRCAQDVGR
jgi:formylglycine-generating enzyme required for sulfatase activity